MPMLLPASVIWGGNLRKGNLENLATVIQGPKSTLEHQMIEMAVVPMIHPGARDQLQGWVL